MKKTMEYKGFTAEVRDTGPRLRGDHVFGLPQGAPIRVYYADEFINYPENWMKGQGVFVVPVQPEHGLWFNWRGNDAYNTAIVPTIKGCNPITGMKTSGFFLEKYEKKCPIHNCDFIGDRFCEKCGYKWPDRNYQSMDPLWWDGFRADDGTVRQFFISEDEMRDIATHMIGKENTVPAFGFAFFTTKERREPPKIVQPRSSDFLYLNSGSDSYSVKTSYDSADTWVGSKGDSGGSGDVCLYHNSLSYESGHSSTGDTKMAEENITLTSSNSAPAASMGTLKKSAGIKKSARRKKKMGGGIICPDSAPVMRSAEPPKPVKEVSIGAGAKIRQELNRDTYSLDSWKEAPDAVMTIYFVFPEKLEELKSKGMRNISSAKEGMLQNLPVG